MPLDTARDGPSTHGPDSSRRRGDSSEPRPAATSRRTATRPTMAGEIEARWQDYWDEHGTFHAPNPAGPLADPDHPRAGAPEAVRAGHVPVPVRRGAARRAPAGLHRHRLLRPLPAHGRPQRAARDGLRRVRPAGRAVRRADRHAPAHDDRGRTSSATAASCAGWAWPTTTGARSPPPTSTSTAGPSGSSCRSSTPGTTRPAQGPPDRRAGRGVRRRRRGRRRTAAPWAELSDVERRRIVDDHRLAYVSEAPVNWCPGLGTVLANEEVTADGRSERGNFPVFKRSLKQWMMRITAYADRLLDDLDALDWPESVKLMQRNWIGRSTGAHIDFAVRRPGRSGCSPPGRTPCSAPRTWCWRPSTSWSTRWSPAAWPEGTRTPGPAGTPPRPRRSRRTGRSPRRRPTWSGRPTPGEDRRLHRRVRHQPGQRRSRSRSSSPTTCWPATAPAPSWRCPGRTSGTGSSPRSSTCRSSARSQPPEGFEGKAYLGDGPAINSANRQLA